jgi:glycosyltransferase involved in cell wall biosynthesis
MLEIAKDRKLLSLVFSFRNEESNLSELLIRISNVYEESLKSKYRLELIFVNDCSNDNSLNILTEVDKSIPTTVINLSRRFGVGPGVMAGFEYSKGDAVVYMDCDLQDPPELIPELVSLYENGFDVVHTRRIKRLGENPFKMGLTILAYKFINRVANIDLPVNSGDFKLLSRRAINEIISLKEYDPYIRGLSVWVGFKQTIVDYVRQPRFAGRSQFKLFSKGPIFEFIRGATSFSNVFLFGSLFIGSLGLFISFGLICYVIVAKINGVVTSGVTTIILTISTLSSLILISNGILSIYLSRLFEQSKRRPRYIIESINSNA